jgi:hypothetical protein
MNTRTVRFSAAAFAGALLLTLVSSSGPSVAQDRSPGATVTGTWFITAGVPVVKLAVYTYHQDGTVSGVVSPARTPILAGPIAGAFESSDHGAWRRVGSGFESSVYRFDYDPVTGGALAVVRIRSTFTLDPGFESATGAFAVTLWTCPAPTSCPDPNVTAPDFPGEFSPPGSTLTMTRVHAG